MVPPLKFTLPPNAVPVHTEETEQKLVKIGLAAKHALLDSLLEFWPVEFPTMACIKHIEQSFWK